MTDNGYFDNYDGIDHPGMLSNVHQYGRVPQYGIDHKPPLAPGFYTEYPQHNGLPPINTTPAHHNSSSSLVVPGSTGSSQLPGHMPPITVTPAEAGGDYANMPLCSSPSDTDVDHCEGFVSKPMALKREKMSLATDPVISAALGMMQMKNAGSSMPTTQLPEHESSIARAVAISQQSRRPRSEKKPIPEDLKDMKYFERRKRNNTAAKKSRDSRKNREDEIAIRASFLEKENAILRAQVSTLREEANSLRQLLLQKRARP